MASHLIPIDDGGVEPLMAHWGGEVASMWIDDQAILSTLSSVGKRAVVEVAVPLSLTNHSFSAGKAAVASFDRSLARIPSDDAFDLYATQPLPASPVLGVHCDGQPTFFKMAKGYPQSFAHHCRWTDLAGELC